MLSLSLPLAAFLGATALPPTSTASPTDGPRVPNATQKAVDIETAIRVRMELVLLQPTDGLMYDDEIYYFVVQPADGNTLKIAEKRPAGDPDVWQMGGASELTLSRWLFRGKVSIAKPMKLGLVLAEQDASSVGDKESSGGGSYAMYDPTLFGGMLEAKSRIEDRDHQEIGFVQIVASGKKLKVAVRDMSANDTDDKVLSADGDSAKVQLNGPGRYVLRIELEPDTGPAPKSRRWLGSEDDDCTPGKNLTVKTVDGDVAVASGQTVIADIGAQTFKWYCGGSEESAVARPGTDFLEVRRSKSDDTVYWRCFKAITLSPDVTW